MNARSWADISHRCRLRALKPLMWKIPSLESRVKPETQDMRLGD
jgi:hypothetical protein